MRRPPFAQLAVLLISAFLSIPAAAAPQPGLLAPVRTSARRLAALATDSRVARAVVRLRTWDFSTPTGIPEGWDPAGTRGRWRCWS